jgi:5-methylthioadenosine/S-adenosylhomocysteine deaminase
MKIPTDCTILIVGGTVLPMDGSMRVIEDGTVAIVGDSIAAVETRDDFSGTLTADTIIDASRKLVMPGLVNTHTHTPMTVLRGHGDDMVLQDWLQGTIWPWERKHINPESVLVSSRLAIAEMLRAGITTFNDMYFYGMVTANLARETGIRALISEPYADGGVYTFDEMLTATTELMKEFSDDPLVVPCIAPHSAYAATKEQLRKCAELSAEYAAPLHTHLSETAEENASVLETTGMRPVAYMDSLGLLTRRTIAGHCVHIEQDEIDLMRERGVGVSHNPQSEMKLASGVAPVPAMVASGLKVGLGTDGAASNNVLDIFEEVKAAALLHKVTSGDPTTLDARIVAAMATRVGAEVLGLGESVGTLEAGKKADIIMLDFDSPHMTPCYNPYSHVAYVAKGSDVDTVIVNGRVLMRGRELLTIDLEMALRAMNDLAKRFG